MLTGTQLGRGERLPLSFFEKCPDDIAHLCVKFYIQNFALKISRRKKLTIFLCRAFFPRVFNKCLPKCCNSAQVSPSSRKFLNTRLINANCRYIWKTNFKILTLHKELHHCGLVKSIFIELTSLVFASCIFKLLNQLPALASTGRHN